MRRCNPPCGITHELSTVPTRCMDARGMRYIIVSKADRMYRDFLAASARRVIERCNVVSVSSFREAEIVMEHTNITLMLSGSVMPDGDIVDFLARMQPFPGRLARVLVVTQCKDLHFIAMLNELRIAGVFDASSEGTAAFEGALAQVVKRQQYWSPSIRELLGSVNRMRRRKTSLTPTERLVLSAIGDGSDDRTAAERLGMHPAAIHSMRRNLHRKLKIQHRGQLVQTAAQYGFVRFTALGVTRPGFQLLLQESRR
jgi:DNA-binding NarL/FixJ family response regulator